MNTSSSIPPTNKNEAQGIARPLANFHPTVWGEFFIHLLASENQIDHAQVQQRVEMLKEEVRTMFSMSSTAYDGRRVEEEMNLVDALQRLGLAYHFEEEISEALARIHGSQMMVVRENLHVVSLRFRLLRQGAYEISSDQFNKFKDVHGHFRGNLRSDIQGLLSMYEASYLGTPEDGILEEAKSFCKRELESMLDRLQPPLTTEVVRALDIPLIRRIKRLEAREYLSFYEVTERRNDVILELAKLDFNRVQSLHQEEIRDLTRWGIGEVEELPEYMKTYFMALSDTIKEVEDKLLDKQKSYFVQYLKEELKAIAKAYLKEAEWRNEGHTPTFQDHLKVSLASSGVSLLTCGFFVGMDVATQDAFDWLASNPKIVEASAMIGRLVDDIESHEIDHAQMQQREEMLKEEVRTMFSMSSTAYDGRRVEEEMNLVDALQRLGLAYHFEEEISEAFARIHGSQMMVVSKNLHAVSLRFRLLRQGAYEISSDQFNKFKDVHGHFRGNLSSNIQGLLSLYEASYLGTPEDDILEEAKSFCKRELESMLDRLQPPLTTEVVHALDMPLIRRIKRLEAREYLSFYEAAEGRNDVTLELAKLDFNRVQSLHQEEIRGLTGWDIGEIEGLPEYMKTYFMALSDTIKEFEDMLLDGQKSYFVQYLKEEIKAIAKAYLKEAEWCNEGHIPTLQDHLQVSVISSGASLLICGFFLCMRDIATQDTFDWLASYPKIIEASAMIARLIDDISTHEFEENRQHVASTVRCYMEEYGVSKEMARKKLCEMVDTTWKVMNEEWLKTTQIPLQLLAIDHAQMQQRVEMLKEEVRTMFSISSSAYDGRRVEEEMNLVDALQRLGLPSHFEVEISEALARIHGSQMMVVSDDLHPVSLRFRLLRQGAYEISSDQFNKFKDVHGHFRGNLSSDIQGLLSLYEASYLSTPEDDILEEAKSFCKRELESMLDRLQPPLTTEVVRALGMPLIRRIKRLEAREYLSFYEAVEGRNDVILELDKLDFNRVQSLHQEEIRSLTGWWKELGLIKKLSFARDRLVECYFWIVGVQYEPHLAHGRMLMAKLICLTSVLDDIYDSYGTLEELLLLTDAMQRWDIGEVEGLPEYMKTCFMALSDTIKEFEDMLLDGQKSHFVQRSLHLLITMKALAKVYLKEAEWCNEGHIPTLQDHLQVSMISSGTSLLICGFFLCMRDIATQDTFDWLASYPKIIEASAMITRLKGDISSHEFEENRQHVASAVRCYMEEYGVSKEMAHKKLREMVETAWKTQRKRREEPRSLPSLELPPPASAGAPTTHWVRRTGRTSSSTSPLLRPVVPTRGPPFRLLRAGKTGSPSFGATTGAPRRHRLRRRPPAPAPSPELSSSAMAVAGNSPHRRRVSHSGSCA
ncbi:hypothetical protein Taro_051179 [Colocasia esculenta]|uniref:Uncharacterized protein n=1 Tax=Colocasia esculenta TaxID=4460 RepID=A0A843XG03_COLES|nr:hypothetical protein [Colocasia esculenta]